MQKLNKKAKGKHIVLPYNETDIEGIVERQPIIYDKSSEIGSQGYSKPKQNETTDYEFYSFERKAIYILFIFTLTIIILFQQDHGSYFKMNYAQQDNQKKKLEGNQNGSFSNSTPQSNLEEENQDQQIYLDEAGESSYSADYVNFVKTASDFDPNKKRDVCIVGAGMTGTVIAERYANILNKKVLVIDRRPHIGGTCFDFEEPKSGLMVNKYGAHILHTSHPMVWKYLNIHKNAPGWEAWKGKIAVIAEDGIKARYPVSAKWVKAFATQGSDEYLDDESFKEYLNKIRIPCRASGCINEEEYIRSQVGEDLYQEFYSPYFVKAFGAEANEVPPGVGNLNTHSILENHYAFREKYVVIPKKGYTRWFAALLDNPNIETVVGVDFIDYKKALLKNCEKIVYTGPIDTYFDENELAKAGLSGDEFKLQYRGLRFHATSRTFSTTKDIMEAEKNKEAIMESPDWENEYTRIVDYKLMDQDSNKNHLSTIIVKEIPTKLKYSTNKEPFWAVPTKKNLELFNKYKVLSEKEEKTEFIGMANYRNFNLEETIENALLRFHEMAGRPKIPDMPGFFVVKNIDWLHIPKTGTSFIYNMVAYKCDERISEAVDPTKELNLIYNKVAHNLLAPPCAGKGLYHGHHPMLPGMNGFYKDEGSRFNVVTMMRDPISRTASGFVHGYHDCMKMMTKRGFKGPRPSTVCSWLENNPTEEQLQKTHSMVKMYKKCVKGCQTYMLNGHGCSYGHANRMTLEDKDRLTKNALKKVQDFAFVGLTDSWQQSLCVFQKHFPRPSGKPYNFELLKKNTRPTASVKCKFMIENILKEQNFTDKMDGLLFKQVEKHFHQNLGRCAHSYTETGDHNI